MQTGITLLIYFIFKELITDVSAVLAACYSLIVYKLAADLPKEESLHKTVSTCL